MCLSIYESLQWSFNTVVSLCSSWDNVDKNESISSQFPPDDISGEGTDASFGSQIDDVIAKRMKTTPPIRVTESKVIVKVINNHMSSYDLTRGGRLYRLLEKRIFEFFFLSGRIFEEYSNILEHKEMHKETYFNLAFI